MKEKIKEAFIDLKIEVIKSVILHVFIDSSIVLLLSNLILSPLSNWLTFALVILITALFGVLDFILRYRRFTLNKFESYNPQLSEILRTCHDNLERDNPIIKEMIKETIYKLKTASTYGLIGHREAIAKVIFIGLLSIFTINLTILDINMQNSAQTGDLNNVIKIGNVNIHKTDDIYGERDNILIGEKNLEIILNPSSIININEVREDIEERKFSVENFPLDISAQADITNEEEIPEEFELIKEYNLRARGLK